MVARRRGAARRTGLHETRRGGWSCGVDGLQLIEVDGVWLAVDATKAIRR